jgi:glyoxylase-like metal-dependent hydrolase (beta-lactamase superfamily II)
MTHPEEIVPVLHKKVLRSPGDPAGVADGVRRLPLLVANAYVLNAPDGRRVLVDCGVRLSAFRIRWILSGQRPSAIVLTHGHADHAGGAGPLACAWGVPVYAHPLELPYLTGRADYPPPDQAIGGPVGFLTRWLPNRRSNLAGHVQPLPEDGTVPLLDDWRWLHAPGHTPGHIALFRPADRTLLSGDAVVTVDLESWFGVWRGRGAFGRPPAASTADWGLAIRTIAELAELNPWTVAAGHGPPLAGPAVAAELRDFAVLLAKRAIEGKR